MQIISHGSERKNHVNIASENSLIFNAEAVEVTVLDRWGKAVWKQQRELSGNPIRWNGIDDYGSKVSSGTCKIVYLEKQVAYVPFLFIQK